jgi:hypothetical protein
MDNTHMSETTEKTDRSHWPVKVRRLCDIDEQLEDMLFWLSRPPVERYQQMQELRELFYGESTETDEGLDGPIPVIIRPLR